MVDVQELFTSTTPETVVVPELAPFVARGTRRRIGKRVGAAALSLALLGGAMAVVNDLGTEVDPPFTVDGAEAAGWKPLPAAPLAERDAPYVAELSDGRLLIAGGYDDLSANGESGPTALADGAVLDAARREWERIPSAPFDTDEEYATLDLTLHGDVLWAHHASLGLFGPRGAAEEPSLAFLDLAGDADGWEWTTLPPLPLAMGGFPQVTVTEGAIVVIGSSGGPSSDGQPQGVAVWREGEWAYAGFVGNGSTSGAFTAVSDDVLVVAGGTAADGTVLSDAAVMDLTADRLAWVDVDPMPAPRQTHTVGDGLVVDGRAWIGGGFSTVESGGQPLIVDEDGSVVDDADFDGQFRPPTPERGAAWLDLATGTWEEAELDVPALPFAERTRGPLAVADVLTLEPTGPTAGAEGLSYLVADGTILGVDELELPEGLWYHARFDGTIPVMVLGGFSGRPDTRVALRQEDGSYLDVTYPLLPADESGPLRHSLTYHLVDDALLAIGGASSDGRSVPVRIRDR